MYKLPKSNLSHSQIELWNKTSTHRDYVKRYFYGEVPFYPKEFAFGSMIADELKKDNLFDVPEGLAEVFSKLPTVGIPEVQIVCQMRGFWTMSYLDRCTKNYDTIIEFKTGKGAWTLDKVQKDKQLEFYSWAIWKNFGVIPVCWLAWMETFNDSASEFGVSLTGNVEIFYRQCTEKELIETEKYICDTAKEIEKYYCLYLDGKNIESLLKWR